MFWSLLIPFAAYGMPVIGDPSLMNYNSVILVGVLLLASIWWFAHGIRKYSGPVLTGIYIEGVSK